MAGTDVLGRPCTFSVSVRISTFCAISSAPRRYVMRKKKREYGFTPNEKANSKVKTAWAVNILKGASRQIHCLWMFSFSFALFFLPLPKFSSLLMYKLTSGTESRQEENCRISFTQQVMWLSPLCWRKLSLWRWILNLFIIIYFLEYLQK